MPPSTALPTSIPQTLFDKLWASHEVHRLPDQSSILYLDRIFMHERTGSIALTSLAERGRDVRNPAHVFCTMDHIIDTYPGRNDKTLMPGGTEFITTTRQATQAAGIRLFDINDPDQGISHLVSAEQGISLPGLSMVCPDSHTSTLGALGALAWGIGSSDCEQALATETLRVNKPRQMRVRCEGELATGVSAKDLILYLIGRFGAAGGERTALEFTGPVIDALPMDARFTLCNMATEFSAFTGLIAPDTTTIDYVAGRPYAPTGTNWERAVAHWGDLYTDDDANFDIEQVIDCNEISPMISWGTSPAHSIGVLDKVPTDHSPTLDAAELRKATDYMALQPGQSLFGLPIQGAFIGSCTNGRLADLEAAASILRHQKVAPDVKAVCTPGSMAVKHAAEAAGIDQIFKAAGFEWREPGCSLCFFAGGEGFEAGERTISTTNRNFEGRQGRGVRTHISSPVMVAAAAIAGKIVDCREYMVEHREHTDE